MVHSCGREVGQPRSQGLSSLAPGVGKKRDPGNEVGSGREENRKIVVRLIFQC